MMVLMREADDQAEFRPIAGLEMRDDYQEFKMSQTFKAALVAAACVLAVAANATASDRGKGGRDNNRNRDSTEIWKNQRSHENGCAIGNDPPPGANCTNRDNQNRYP